MILKRISAFVLIFLLFILQTSIFGFLPIGGARPDLIFVFLLIYATYMGEFDAMALGFFTGILVDSMFGSLIGFSSLLLVFVGYLAGKCKDIMKPGDFKIPLIAVLIGKPLTQILTFVFRFLLFGNFDLSDYFIRIILPEYLYTILCFGIIYPVYYLLETKVFSRFEEVTID